MATRPSASVRPAGSQRVSESPTQEPGLGRITNGSFLQRGGRGGDKAPVSRRTHGQGSSLREAGSPGFSVTPCEP